MCTKLYCTTCGAMGFRMICKDLGAETIKELIESVTQDDFISFKKREYGLIPWREPFEILLNDGFKADPGCFMMTAYDQGEGFFLGRRNKVLLLEISNVKIYALAGNIFNYYGTEITALFNSHNLSAVSDISLRYKESLPKLYNGIIATPTAMLGGTKAIYYKSLDYSFDGKQCLNEAKKAIASLLSEVDSSNYNSLSMNGVHTHGYSEYDNIKIIINWIKKHPDCSINEIVLVDRDGGFNRLKSNIDFNILLNNTLHGKNKKS